MPFSLGGGRLPIGPAERSFGDSLELDRLVDGGKGCQAQFGGGRVGGVRLEKDEGVGGVLLAEGVDLVGGPEQGGRVGRLECQAAGCRQ